MRAAPGGALQIGAKGWMLESLPQALVFVS